jgi:hypothetical protein
MICRQGMKEEELDCQGRERSSTSIFSAVSADLWRTSTEHTSEEHAAVRGHTGSRAHLCTPLCALGSKLPSATKRFHLLPLHCCRIIPATRMLPKRELSDRICGTGVRCLLLVNRGREDARRRSLHIWNGISASHMCNALGVGQKIDRVKFSPHGCKVQATSRVENNFDGHFCKICKHKPLFRIYFISFLCFHLLHRFQIPIQVSSELLRTKDDGACPERVGRGDMCAPCPAQAALSSSPAEPGARFGRSFPCNV